MPRADGPFQVLEKEDVGADNSADLRANPFQKGGYDVPHHGRIEPSSPRKEEPKFESQMHVSSKGSKTRSSAKFVNLVTHLDDKGICDGIWDRAQRQLESSTG